MRIIGLDPGLRFLGWGVIEAENGRLHHVNHGVIHGGSGDMPTRLVQLYQGLSGILDDFTPGEAAVEETFVNANAASALKLGQARSICLLQPALREISVAEYAPNTVKKSLTGQGHADKSQVGHMVAMLLPGVRPESEDATDALAIAICHAHHRSARALAAKVAS